MTKVRAPGMCPIDGCFNRAWSAKGLPVCGECAYVIERSLRFGSNYVPSEIAWEMETLRHIIARQTRELRELRGVVDTKTEPAAKQSPTDGTIYYLRVGGYIKIGWTADLGKRMRSYSPDSILLATHPGTRKDEHRLHKRFAAHRTHGREWYALTPSLMHHIEQMAAEHGAPDPVAFAAQPVTIPQARPAQPIKPRGWTGRAS